MVVLSKKSQILLLIFSIAFILSLGIIGFFFVQNQGDLPPEEGRYLGEIILFLSLLFCLLVLIGYGLVFLRNRNILRELDKIIEMSKYNNFSPVQSLERLGKIGEKIGAVYRNVNQVSEKRALKISSLSALSAFLLDNLPLPVIVTDITGAVTLVSKQFKLKYEDEANLPGDSINSFFPELKIKEVWEKFDENFSKLELRQGKIDLTVYPIRNRELEIAYLVFVLTKSTLIQEETIKQGIDKLLQKPEKQGIFRKLLGKRSKEIIRDG